MRRWVRAPLLRIVTVGALIGRLTGRRLGLLIVKQGPAHFEPFAEQCVAGNVNIHIDRTFGLDEVPQALAHVGEGAPSAKLSSRLPKSHRWGQV